MFKFVYAISLLFVVGCASTQKTAFQCNSATLDGTVQCEEITTEVSKGVKLPSKAEK